MYTSVTLNSNDFQKAIFKPTLGGQGFAINLAATISTPALFKFTGKYIKEDFAYLRYEAAGQMFLLEAIRVTRETLRKSDTSRSINVETSDSFFATLKKASSNMAKCYVTLDHGASGGGFLFLSKFVLISMRQILINTYAFVRDSIIEDNSLLSIRKFLLESSDELKNNEAELLPKEYFESALSILLRIEKLHNNA